MIRLATVFLAILLFTLSAWADSSDKPTSAISVERTRIQTDRHSGELVFDSQKAACYARFAVTDCLHEIRTQRRRLLDDLRRRTGVLNDIERKK